MPILNNNLLIHESDDGIVIYNTATGDVFFMCDNYKELIRLIVSRGLALRDISNSVVKGMIYELNNTDIVLTTLDDHRTINNNAIEKIKFDHICSSSCILKNNIRHAAGQNSSATEDSPFSGDFS